MSVLVLMPRDRVPMRGTVTSVTSPPPAHRTGARRRTLLGHSVRGRPIYVTEVGDRSSPRRLLVVGCIHGDEAAGIAIASAVERAAPRSEDVWVVDDLNPDGLARRTRQNAHGVDLNRNFPAGWRALGVPGDQQYPGPAPLSEPEARIARSLVARLRPSVSVWFHQPLGVVDQSGGDLGVELHLARLLGSPAAPAAALSGERRWLGEPRSAPRHGLRGRASCRPSPAIAGPAIRARSHRWSRLQGAFRGTPVGSFRYARLEARGHLPRGL